MNLSAINNPAKSTTLLLLFIAQSMLIANPGLMIRHAAAEELVPVDPTEYPAMNVAGGGGGPFQVCMQCRCCGGPTCVSTSCCFVLDCQHPPKPGVCSFVPKICNCSSCSS